ncbi:HNH endonuclease family protein [Gordonia sp. CPCC 205333]|uniref:HNH endonuclease family protein n=1 Tax=Gordonia sp. CPCC 205333 TaxID=3140790 RepID=UPI003AF3A794
MPTPHNSVPPATSRSASNNTGVQSVSPTAGWRSARPDPSARSALEALAVKGRAPKTGFSRRQFGAAWTDANQAHWGENSLSTREDILSRDLVDVLCKYRVTKASPHCVVQSGQLHDPYTGMSIGFVRGSETSTLVPVDHVVSLGDAWQKGAQQLSTIERTNFANDPLNLITTTRVANLAKRDSDAATWLVPNRHFRCSYVARQIAVKTRYRLWVTDAEKQAMSRVLSRCPNESATTDVQATSRTTWS